MRRSPLKRRARLKAQRVPRTLDDEARARWNRRVAGRRCHMCGDAASHGHHVIPKQQLKLHHLEAHLWDLRNYMALCARCHGDHHSWARRIPYRQLSSLHVEFAESYGLGWLLEREYPKDTNAMKPKGQSDAS